MQSRAVHWLVLWFATLWFGVLVPVHNRGEIKLPGTAGAAAHQCCPTEPPNHGGDAPVPAAPQSTCAVCFFIATLDVAPPVTVAPVRLGPAGIATVEVVSSAPPGHRALPFHSRAPPAA